MTPNPGTKTGWAILALLVLIMMPALPAGALETGAARLQLDGGSRGTIMFPHRDHQQRLGDCNLCHKLFPKQRGALVSLKKAGKLARKQVMNKLCIKCHKAEKLAGRTGGPTTCSKCHTRR